MWTHIQRVSPEQHTQSASLSLNSFSILFLSEECHPLTDNSITLLFGRLRKRAGITRKGVGPALLRDTFAMGRLQAGVDLAIVRELLGQEESVLVKRSLWMSNEAKGVDNHVKEQTGMSATLSIWT